MPAVLMRLSLLRLCPVSLWLYLLGLTGVSTAQADQNDPALPDLFDELATLQDSVKAEAIETQIWQAWMRAPDEAAQALMAEIAEATGMGDLDAAIEACDRLTETHPEFAEGWNRRATLHYMAGQFDASVADIGRTLALEPRHFGAISGLGLIFLRQGNSPAALEAFEQVLEINPNSQDARASVERLRDEIDSGI